MVTNLSTGRANRTTVDAFILPLTRQVFCYVFYKRINTVSGSKFTTARGSQLAGYSKLDTSDKVSRPFEVFLCYKKSSVKDYADHLKTGLEELGLHTFKDCKDIPQTVDTEEGWASSRDKALNESKYFVLIMTPGFDLSREVANEIRMARKQTNKTFIYFRHRSMGRNIVVNLEDEVFDSANLNKSLLKPKRSYYVLLITFF